MKIDSWRRPLENGTKHACLSENKANTDVKNSRGSFTKPASASVIPNLTAEACLAHLKLLEAFSMLRSDISSQDGAFDLHDYTNGTKSDQDSSCDARVAIEQKRWSIFVSEAVLRFSTWWQSVLQPDSAMTTINRLADAATGEEFLQSPPISFGGRADNPTKLHCGLPPLDVLMVWHAFMLNPRNYLNDCIRFGKLGVWNTSMPWTAIYDAIDQHTFAYVVEEDVQTRWTKATGLAWHTDTTSKMTKVTCASCHSEYDVPWTTQSWAGSCPSTGAGNGFSDPGFEARCICGFTATHGASRVLHFARDLEHLIHRNVPMPGTILSARGKLPHAGIRSSLQSLDLLAPSPSKSRPLGIDFPNIILHIGYGENIMGEIDGWRLQAWKTESLSMADVKSHIESAVQDKLGYHAQLDGRTSVRRSKPAFVTQKEGRLSLRRMMSAYWENGSMFSLDLVGAVIRQGEFVNKMHEIDWLHSPSALSTMGRLLQRYERFFDIMGHSGDNIAVPTLDIDLAWHTHQLSPRDYYEYSLEHTYPTTFIDHDDKIEEAKLSDAFIWTSKTYWERHGEMYSECTCWYCEAVYESHRPSGLSSHILKRSEQKHFDEAKEKISSQSAEAGQNLDRTGHISAHSVVAHESAFYNRIKKDVHESWLQECYKRAQRRAAKKERKDANRSHSQRGKDKDQTSRSSNTYLASSTAYPYSVTPVAPGVYICDPNCNVAGTGVAGACCNVTGLCGTGGSCAGGAGGGGGAFGSCASSTAGCGTSLGGCFGAGGAAGSGSGPGACVGVGGSGGWV